MRNPRVATGSKKGNVLAPRGAPTAETAVKLGAAVRTPALCLPSAYARTCARLSLAKVQPWKQKVARLGITSAGELGFECTRVHARTDKAKARRRAPVWGDQKLGHAVRERARARVHAMKGECVRVLLGRARDQTERLCSAAMHASVRARPACRRSRWRVGKHGANQWAARMSTKAAPPARNNFSAWLDGRHHQRKHGGAVASRDMAASAQGSTRNLGSKAGHHKRWGKRGAHLRPKGARR
jgi:hypothetical protein